MQEFVRNIETLTKVRHVTPAEHKSLMFLPWFLGDAVEIEFHSSECCLYFVLILLALVLLV